MLWITAREGGGRENLNWERCEGRGRKELKGVEGGKRGRVGGSGRRKKKRKDGGLSITCTWLIKCNLILAWSITAGMTVSQMFGFLCQPCRMPSKWSLQLYPFKTFWRRVWAHSPCPVNVKSTQLCIPPFGMVNKFWEGKLWQPRCQEGLTGWRWAPPPHTAVACAPDLLTLECPRVLLENSVQSWKL